MVEIEAQEESFENTTNRIISEKKLSHAYLIEINDNKDIGQVVDFAKKIITSTIKEQAVIEEINKKIDKNAYDDLQYIKPDGQWIKKEQIIDIKTKLSTKSLASRPRVYIIEEADKLNKSSANTLLKFLEEPEENIYAILITKSKYQIIETIISRCQYIKLKSDINISGYQIEDKETAIELVTIIEEKKDKAIPYLNTLNQEILSNRKDIVDLLTKTLLLYNDIMYVKMEIEPIYYKEIKDKLKKWEELNNNKTLSIKILVINNTIENLKYNTNIKLMLDKLIINMSGCEINV